MAGLFGDSWDDPRTMAALQMASGLLAAGGPSRNPTNIGMGLFGGLQAYQQSMSDAKKQKQSEEELALRKLITDAQIKNYEAEAQARTQAAELKRQELERAQAQREFLLRAVSPVGALGANPGSPTQANADTVGSAPQIGPDFYRQAVALGIPVETVKALAESGNFGRSKVARTIETTDEQGRPVTLQVDEFGTPIGKGLSQWKAPMQVNQGDRTTFVDPVSLAARGQFGVNMSPAERDAAARGWASNSIARERLNMDRNEAMLGGKPPAGYRWKQDGTLEPIPGGPAGNDKPLTDAQAKANLFGTRALESNKILEQLATQGVDRPGNIKSAAESVPFIGGGLGTLTNWTQSNPQQQVEQAQRDFVNAVLRRESGAVISTDEFNNARKQYFPQIGDSPEVRAQKSRNRQIAIQGIMAEVPDAKRGVQATQPAAVTAIPLPPNPTARDLVKGQVYQTPKGALRWNGMKFEDQ